MVRISADNNSHQQKQGGISARLRTTVLAILPLHLVSEQQDMPQDPHSPQQHTNETIRRVPMRRTAEKPAHKPNIKWPKGHNKDSWRCFKTSHLSTLQTSFIGLLWPAEAIGRLSSSAWRIQAIPLEWSRAITTFIHKEKDSHNISQCQKVGVPGFPGPMEHSAMIAEQIHQVEQVRSPHSLAALR